MTKCRPHSFHVLSLGNMNTLSGKSVLSLCIRTTNSIRVLASCTPSALPLGYGLTRPLLGVERVCHSAANSNPSSIRTKKRGYDITRNPHLNKVTSYRSKKNARHIACVEAKTGAYVIFSYMMKNGKRCSKVQSMHFYQCNDKLL